MTEQPSGIDWALLKLQYEVLHEDVETLAVENGTTPRVINYAIRSENWQRVPLTQAIKDWSDIDSLDQLTDSVVEQVTTRLSALALLKQAAMNPRYIALETAIVGKAMEIIRNINSQHPLATTQLKNIAEVFEKLKGANGLLSKAAQDAGGDAEKMVVVLQQRFEHTGQSSQAITTTSVDAPQRLLSEESGV